MEKKVPFLLSPNQVEQIIGKVTFPKYRFMIRLLYELAIRVGELVNIQKSDINIESMTVVIHGKGHKQRLLPLTTRQCYQLRCYMSAYPSVKYLFENNKSTAYTTRGVRNIVYDACGNTFGHYLVHPHTFRHSRATNLISHDVGLWHVQQLLGHSSLRTTSVYLHYDVAHLRNAIANK